MRILVLLDWSLVGDWGIKILGALGGITGTVLGIYNFNLARKKERRELEREQTDWQIYIALRAEMNKTGRNAYTPDEGSEQHQWAERMVDKGLLELGSGGVYYTLPPGS